MERERGAEPEPDGLAEPEGGGDPACWLSRVCPECGHFAEREPAQLCACCGARLPGASA